ncbi:xyloside xylosyltransferase 1-like [Centruroides vittatus]|uniref:xyloside xylosyltransferase 1-like n=1 Tax=Centruroides vittatus TaxID=120091 RepID=UPI00350FE52D
MYWFVSSLMINSQTPEKVNAIREWTFPRTETVHLSFMCKYAYRNMKILRNLLRCVKSIIRYTSRNLHFHIFLDKPSKMRVKRTLKKIIKETGRTFSISFYDINNIIEKSQDFIKIMRKFFFTKDVGRYNDDIFFISELIHHILSIDKVIMIDLDLIFNADIGDLHRHFHKFSPTNVIGLANDLQPQYRVDFKFYRKLNPQTSVGAPRPGKQGFNTGVVLFHLQKMRQSELYNSLLNHTAIEYLCKKYYFEGYLGHQDFYTLTGMEYPELYYVLDCTWNRQLDTGWNNSVDKNIFDLYHECNGKIKVIHGNGDAFMPY